jgi:hypothetical protein
MMLIPSGHSNDLFVDYWDRNAYWRRFSVFVTKLIASFSVDLSAKTLFPRATLSFWTFCVS